MCSKDLIGRADLRGQCEVVGVKKGQVDRNQENKSKQN